MKLFIIILFAVTIIGGFAGAEILDTSFSIIGAVIGGVGTATVLLGLGAYFTAQSKKEDELPPEIRGVFDRMVTGKENPTKQEVQIAKQSHLKGVESENTFNPNIRLSIESTIRQFIAEDAEIRARGEVPEIRLMPQHAIKRDIIITAYTKDLEVVKKYFLELNLSQSKKNEQLTEINEDFDKKIYGLKRLSWQELDKIILLMKKSRSDLKEIEQIARSKNVLYKYVDPIFI